MSMNRKTLEAEINGILSLKGFKKKGTTWYRQTAGALQAVDLQKSANGGQFYVNLCFFPAGMVVDGMPTPKAHKCPVWIRIGSLFQGNRKQIEELFDLERETLAEATRLAGIQDIFCMVVSFFDQLRELSDLKRAIEQGVFKRGAVNIAAQKYLGIGEEKKL